MITLTKSGNAIVFTFDDNDHYLNDGIIEVPVNSLTLVTDDSQMATFRKAASNDIFISATYDELGMSKAELESWFKENAFDTGGVTEEWVEEYVSESISGKADVSDVQEIASDVTTVSGDVNTLSGSVESLTGAVNTLSGDVSTLSGSVDSNHNAITAVVGDVQTLSGQVQGDEAILTGHTANTDIHVTASDKQNWNNKSDFSGSYNDLTDKPTIPVVPTNVSAFNNDAGYATSGYVDSSVSGKVNTTDFNTYSASTDNRLSEDEEVTAAALNSLNSNKQDKLTAGENITINGNVISAAGGGGGNNVIELTQAEYDELTDIDPDAFYIIIDADGGATTGQVQTMINTAIATKQDTLVSGTNIKTINNQSLLGSGNIDIQGGGKAIEAGRGIAITTGATADTVSFNLPISGYSQSHKSIIIGSDSNVANAMFTIATGQRNRATNMNEVAIGIYNLSNNGTVFSVGNGTAVNARHNAFEIRQNGDIYLTLDGQDVKLQDQLGGGLPESAFTEYTAATDARLAEDEEVTAAALNTLNDALDDKADASDLGGLKLVSLTQAQYDALATKDASTLYIITGSN